MEFLHLGWLDARLFNLRLDMGHVLLLVKAVAEAVSVSDEVVQLLISLSVQMQSSQRSDMLLTKDELVKLLGRFS